MKEIRKQGRDRIPEEEKRKTRYFIANEAQWRTLKAKADKAGLTHSQYIIKKLKLDKD